MIEALTDPNAHPICQTEGCGSIVPVDADYCERCGMKMTIHAQADEIKRLKAELAIWIERANR